MDFKLKNFGKIAEADIKLDGITVICGNNNTGKSTVSKALFGFFYSLYDLDNKIYKDKNNAIKNFLFQYARTHTKASGYSFHGGDDFSHFINNEKFLLSELKEYIDQHIVFADKVKITEEELKPLYDLLKLPKPDIINEVVFRVFDNVMNGQIQRVNSGQEYCSISSKIKDKKYEIRFEQKMCSCHQDNTIEHKVYYINNPFALDLLNNPNRSMMIRSMPPVDRNVIEAIINAQADINADSMAGILDSVSNKKKLDEVRKVLKKAYEGDTKISNGLYYYSENNVDFDFRNISTGLKSFALIERMLETGVLKKEDVLILDEPEIHLHSEWQIYYAELIVALQKYFKLTILIVTHSFHFLESLNFYMRQKPYNISENGNYYIPVKTDKGIIMKSCTNNLSELKKGLKSGMYALADLQLAELDNCEDDEEDNE
ncbi:MAG: ATP-binding protein [Ruminococcus sp.]|nr:ATP-binding protein [Ruminococcus sp.]